MKTDHRWSRGEPRLDDMLRDDVMQAVMRRDGVSSLQLDLLIQRVRHRLRHAGADRVGMPAAANDAGQRPAL